MIFFRILLSTAILIALASILTAKEITQQELEKWFNSDTMDPPGNSTQYVNEGNLVFLAIIPQKNIHHHSNVMTIKQQSLKDGWVSMQQCHKNMDVFSQVQLVFKQDRVRNIQVIKTKNISKATVEGSSVQLVDVQQAASLCLILETKALQNNKDGSYTLHNGPFMRRFLDGYYPMHVSLDVNYQGTGLIMENIIPSRQDGFVVNQSHDKIGIDAWFEGRLRTKIRFRVNTL